MRKENNSFVPETQEETSLLEGIMLFLQNKVKIRGGNEDAEASLDDTSILRTLSMDLVRLKWEESWKGRLPVSVQVLNKTTHEHFGFIPVPRALHDEDFACQNLEIMEEIAMDNLGYAYDSLKSVKKESEYTKRVLQERAKKLQQLGKAQLSQPHSGA